MDDDKFFRQYFKVIAKYGDLGEELNSKEIRSELEELLSPLGINVDWFIAKAEERRKSPPVELIEVTPELAFSSDVIILERGEKTPSQLKVYGPAKMGERLWLCKIELVGKFECQGIAMNSVESMSMAFDDLKRYLSVIQHARAGYKVLDAEFSKLAGEDLAVIFQPTSE